MVLRGTCGHYATVGFASMGKEMIRFIDLLSAAGKEVDSHERMMFAVESPLCMCSMIALLCVMR